ncbi:hypothetical protein FOZ62_028078, partial [Perkinsus olseni]
LPVQSFSRSSPPTKRSRVAFSSVVKERGSETIDVGRVLDDFSLDDGDVEAQEESIISEDGEEKAKGTGVSEPLIGKKLNESLFDTFIPSRSRSAIWSADGFLKVRVRATNTVCKEYAVCSKCRTVFKTKQGNTSTLTRHQQACHSSEGVPSVLQFIKDPAPLAAEQRAKLYEACVDLVVSQCLPFTVTESEPFQRLVQLASDLGARNGRPFDATRSLPSAKNVADKVNKRYDAVHENVKERLRSQNRPLQMQFDAWKTYHKGEEVLAVTVALENQYHDNAEPVLLALRKLESGQGEDIAETLQSVLDDYGIGRDEVLFLSDSCQANIKALASFGAASVPCFAHLLQLAVKAATYPSTGAAATGGNNEAQRQARSKRSCVRTAPAVAPTKKGAIAEGNAETGELSLSDPSLRLNDMMRPLPAERTSSIAGILTTVTRLVAVARRTKMNNEIANIEKCTRLSLRNETRWNSTLKMLRSVLRSWQGIIKVFSQHDRLRSFEGLLSRKCLLEAIDELLHPFAIATDRMQAVRPFVFMDTIAQLEKCWRLLNTEGEEDMPEIIQARLLMRDAFRQKVIWRLSTDSLIGCLLNPRMRVKGVENLLIVKEFRESAPGNVQDPDRLSRENIEWVLFNWGFLSGYRKQVTADVGAPRDGESSQGTEANISSTSESSHPQFQENIWDDVIDITALPVWEEPQQPQMDADALTAAVTAECEEYMKLGQHQVDYDVFWEGARDKFPNLYFASRITKYFTLSTARCESVFSQAKSIIGLRRANLKTSTLEQLLVCKTTQKIL